MTNNWKDFIEKNRPLIDEFLRENNPIYTAIALKREILKLLNDKNASMYYFEELIKTGKTQVEQNKELRKILNDLRSIANKRADPQMRFGLNSNLITGIYKKKFLEILLGEVLLQK